VRPDRPNATRRVLEGRIVAAIAVAKRPTTFDELARSLSDVDRPALADALVDLVARGFLAEDKVPSASSPLFDPPTVRYAAVAVKGGLR